MNIHNNKLVRFIDRIEDTLLISILTVMIVLAIFQIFSRNFLSESFVWIEPLLRTLVLWLGLTGAIVAARTNQHIRIDIFTRYFPAHFQLFITRISYLITMSVCGLIAWHATRFIIDEYEHSTIAFSVIPSWVTAIIIPVSFLLMALRYAMLTISPLTPAIIEAVEADS
jgi:C4-dicarboxylate transporter DctQ subunit